MNENKTAEEKDINLIAIKSLIECIDNRDIAEGGIFLDDDNAEFVADILRYHYELLTSKNKMSEVAQLFGKKLGEEFRVRRNYYISCSTVKAKFIDKGFQVLYDGCDYWTYSPDSLVDLLIGKAVIISD